MTMSRFLVFCGFLGSIQTVIFIGLFSSTCNGIFTLPTIVYSARMNQGLTGSKSFTCGFEPKDYCNYIINQGWKVIKANTSTFINFDQNLELNGHYIMTDLKRKSSFQYIFPENFSNRNVCLSFNIVSSGRNRFSISQFGKFNIDVTVSRIRFWKMVKLNLIANNLVFTTKNFISRPSNFMALDSFVFTHGPCNERGCLHPYVSCPSNNGIKSKFCIPKNSVCDGEPDCPGGTDEKNCPKCGPNEFKCLGGGCVHTEKVCNGIRDCQDSSDEHRCLFHDNNKMSFRYQNVYTQVCEVNLKNKVVADKLCQLAGKGSAYRIRSGINGRGVLFTRKPGSRPNDLIALEPNGLVQCKLLNVECTRSEECGVRDLMKIAPNIQDGSFALHGLWPWNAALFKNNAFVCSAAIINKKQLLTTAHCLLKKGIYHVSVGSTLRDQGMKYKVKSIRIHPEYQMLAKNNDIALLELEKPLIFSSFVKPVCLPSGKWRSGKKCYVTGWGRNEKGFLSKNLMKAKVQLVEQDVCKTFYNFINKSILCAANTVSKQPICYGDSGGPLVCQNDNGHWELTGIASFGKKNCAGPSQSPSAFVDVYRTLNWVNKN